VNSHVRWFLVRGMLCFNRQIMPASFHPAVERWFQRAFASPTAAQRDAWPAIATQQHVLIAAPTGSGKTLAAFLAVIDELVREGVTAGAGRHQR
jgi:ATP-dependent Lhr-like helicase